MVKIWYAVDGDGMRNLCLDKPSRFENYWIASKILTTNSANAADFPALTWDDEPVEMELYTKAAVINELKQRWSKECRRAFIDRFDSALLQLIYCAERNMLSCKTAASVAAGLTNDLGKIALQLFDDFAAAEPAKEEK